MTSTIILATDGRFSSLGDYADQATIDAAVSGMVAAGLSGWVCEMTGKYYGRGKVALRPVQHFGSGDFRQAETAFHAARKAAA